MSNSYAKINVLIVTYKQQDVIGRNIESILRQKEFGLNKIIICDDCSPDNNWEVIQSYVNKYPNIITAYRNNPNLGIYGNSNKLVSLRDKADLYCWLEGDDALCDGFFEKIQNYIIENEISLDGPKAFMGDFKIIYPNGSSLIDRRNQYIKKYNHIFGAYLRGLVSWRASLFTASVLNQFVPAILDKGLSLAESSFDCQFFCNLTNYYYVPVVGSVYYAGIGVSSDLHELQGDYHTIGAIHQWNYFKEAFALSMKDKFWCSSQLLKASFYIKPTLVNLSKVLFPFLGGLYWNAPNLFKYIKAYWGPMWSLYKYKHG